MDHYANLGIGTVALFLQNIGTHPFIVLRRQCQVSAESFRCHRTPVTLMPVVLNIYRLQGFSCLWKGLGSALTVRGLLLAVEDCTGCSNFPERSERSDYNSTNVMPQLPKSVQMAAIGKFCCRDHWNIFEYFGIFWIILEFFGIFWNIL